MARPPTNLPKMHQAVITPAVRAPLQPMSVHTTLPVGNEVLISVAWTASTPLNLHQADGGLLVKHPQILGGTTVGTVLAVGPDAKRLKIGDRVFGFTWQNEKQKAMQEYVTAPENLFGKAPDGFDERSLATVPDSFVTAWHTLTTDCAIELPWPKPEAYSPPRTGQWILVWGGSGSVGQFVLQILKFYGYTNVVATASEKHHNLLKELGAKTAVNYRDGNAIEQVKSATGGNPYRWIIDCIGHLSGTVQPIAEIAEKDVTVAIMLPVIVQDATDEVAPIYSMDVKEHTIWRDGVDARGVRTHFYEDNVFNKERLQPEIMPALIGSGAVKPTAFRLVEGETMVERAQKMLEILRRKEVSAERLVWRVNDVQ